MPGVCGWVCCSGDRINISTQFIYINLRHNNNNNNINANGCNRCAKNTHLSSFGWQINQIDRNCVKLIAKYNIKKNLKWKKEANKRIAQIWSFCEIGQTPNSKIVNLILSFSLSSLFIFFRYLHRTILRNVQIKSEQKKKQ